MAAVERRLSQRPALEANDTTALTTEQQTQLDKHKVLVWTLTYIHDIAGAYQPLPSYIVFIYTVGNTENRE